MVRLLHIDELRSPTDVNVIVFEFIVAPRAAVTLQSAEYVDVYSQRVVALLSLECTEYSIPSDVFPVQVV